MSTAQIRTNGLAPREDAAADDRAGVVPHRRSQVDRDDRRRPVTVAAGADAWQRNRAGSAAVLRWLAGTARVDADGVYYALAAES